MIQLLNKKLLRERLYTRASEAELNLAQADLIKANQAVEQASDTLEKSEQARDEAFEHARDYLSLDNLCPMRVSNLHREIETKRSSVEQHQTDYDSCVERARKAAEAFAKKKGQANTFQKRFELAGRAKTFLVDKIEDSRATELYTMRAGSEK